MNKFLKLTLSTLVAFFAAILILEISGKILDFHIFDSDKPVKSQAYSVGLNEFTFKVEELGIFSNKSSVVLATDYTKKIKFLADRESGKVISIRTQNLKFAVIDSTLISSEYQNGKVFIFDIAFRENVLYVSLEDFNGVNCDIYKIVAFTIIDEKFGPIKEIWRHSTPCLIYSRFQAATNFSGRILVDANSLYLTGGLVVDDNLDFVKPKMSINTFDVRKFIIENKIYGAITKINLETGASIQVSKGHRVPQGLVLIKKANGNLMFETEHGPRGGDELNQIIVGKNYGWPYVSLGNGYIRSEKPTFKTQYSTHENYKSPLFFWTPSIGVSQISELDFDIFDTTWNKGDLLITSLKANSLYRVKLNLKGNTVTSVESVDLNRRLRGIVTSGTTILCTTDSGSLLVLTPLNSRTDGQFLKPFSSHSLVYEITKILTHPFDYIRSRFNSNF
jgi:glucose/arabinose dehydrogenase